MPRIYIGNSGSSFAHCLSFSQNNPLIFPSILMIAQGITNRLFFQVLNWVSTLEPKDVLLLLNLPNPRTVAS